MVYEYEYQSISGMVIGRGKTEVGGKKPAPV
jgi:hypothetical protein